MSSSVPGRRFRRELLFAAFWFRMIRKVRPTMRVPLFPRKPFLPLVFVLPVLLACGSGDSPRPVDAAGSAPAPAASIRHLSVHTEDFEPDAPVRLDRVGIGDYTAYVGEYYAPGLPPLRYILLVSSSAGIDRLLVVVNGGTGTPIEYVANGRVGGEDSHKAVLVVGHRGMSADDLEAECALGPGLVECLKSHPTLLTFNPRQNGEDLNRLVPLIQRTEEVRAALSDPDGPVDLETSSYGATILGYALSDARYPPPALRNVSINGPSEPNEVVITSGIANSKRFFENLLAYRATLPPPDSEPPYALEDLAAELRRNSDRHVGDFFDRLVEHWENAETAEAVSLMNEFIRAPDRSRYYRDDWYTQHKLDLLSESSPGTDVSAGFTSRIGLICSSYINRANDPDSLQRYTAALGGPDGVFRYGFLNGYRDLLTICDRARENIASLTAPSGSGSVAANAVLSYAGAMDVKHDPAEADAMLAYFGGTAAKHRVVEPYNAQGGGARPNCYETARRSLFTRDDGTIDAADCAADGG